MHDDQSVFFFADVCVKNGEAAVEFVVAVFEVFVGDGESVEDGFFFDGEGVDAGFGGVCAGVGCGLAFGEVFDEFF